MKFCKEFSSQIVNRGGPNFDDAVASAWCFHVSKWENEADPISAQSDFLATATVRRKRPMATRPDANKGRVVEIPKGFSPETACRAHACARRLSTKSDLCRNCQRKSKAEAPKADRRVAFVSGTHRARDLACGPPIGRQRAAHRRDFSGGAATLTCATFQTN